MSFKIHLKPKAVIRDDEMGDEKLYKSIKMAADEVGVSPATILNHCISGKKLKGFKYRLKDENINTK